MTTHQNSRANWALAIPAIVVLGPIGLAAGAIAALMLISNVFAGFGPESWLDHLAGGGSGAGGRWVVFMISAFITSGCWTGIQKALGRT